MMGDRAELGRRLARICRERRLVLVVAGDWRLAVALGAGVHLRNGEPLGGERLLRIASLITSSAHDAKSLNRARRAGAGLTFLSPLFATASHPEAASFGVVRWVALARGSRGMAVAALGGVDGKSVRGIRGTGCRVVGAIGALAG